MTNYTELRVNIPHKNQLLIRDFLFENCGECEGIEEYSINEEIVDEILGERAYSGGDIPVELYDEIEAALNSHNQTLKFTYSKQENLQLFLRKINDHFPDVDTKIDSIKNEDWNKKSRENFKTITINNELRIVPLWEKKDESNLNEEVYIYPGMGFGTGSHETTKLCLEFISDNPLSHSQEALDLGCGSGILGIALEKKYGCTVDYCDIDLEALENCRYNYRNNFDSLNEDSFFLRDKLPSNKKYDLIFANILASAIIKESNTIQSLLKRNGTIILSGILDGQQDEVLKNFSQNNTIIKKLNDWVAIKLV